MTREQLMSSIRSNILGVYDDVEGNAATIYIDFDDSTQRLIAGTCSNCGIIEKVSIMYDDDFSIQQNIEAINEELYVNGFNAI